MHFVFNILLLVSSLMCGISISQDIDAKEIAVYENFISSWTFSLIGIRFFATLVLLSGILSFFIKNKYRHLLSIPFLLLLADFVSVNSMDSTLSIGLTALGFILVNVFRNNKNLEFFRLNIAIKKKWIKALIIIAFGIFYFFVPYMFSPIATHALQDNSIQFDNKEEKELILKRLLPENLSNNDRHVVALLSTGCPYCFMAAETTGITQRNNKYPKVFAVFPGTKHDAELFMKDSKLDATPLFCTKDEFIQLSEGSFPKVLIMKGYEIEKMYDASSYQHLVIDKLSN